jgi:hypothetical protein
MARNARVKTTRTKKSTARPATRRRVRPSTSRTKKKRPRPTVPPAAAPVPAGGAGTGEASWTPAAGEVGIRVRMYRVGFGDFFLLTLLDAGGTPAHVIIDCGVFKGTSQTGDIGSIEAAVADMAQVTAGQVALLVMTHRHADHIAGFARSADTFKKLEVEAVWMPIWESEYEPKAVRFQAELTRTALGLRGHFTALGAAASPAQVVARKYMENATGELGVAAGAAGSNAQALDLLKHGFPGVTPQFYKAGDTAQLPQALVEAGLSAQILGPPPVTDLDLMKLMDLQKNVGQYLAENGDGPTGVIEPFGRQWVVGPATAPSARERERYSPESFREFVRPRKSWERISADEARHARGSMERMLRQSEPIAALTAAKLLDSFLNNQSLVILFTFKGKKLLFVGDAQAGNWEHWLFETDTPDRKASGLMGAVARQVLTSLDLYKVGHHGSGNATPKVAAETMGIEGHRFTSMCSTQANVYGTEDPDDPTKGTEVPRGPLLDKLASESALVRSDQIAITVGEKLIPAAAPAALPTPRPGTRLETGPLWVDCYL